MPSLNPIRKHGRLKLILVLFDCAGILLAALLTFCLHYLWLQGYSLDEAVEHHLGRVLILAVSLPFLILIFRQNLLYKHKVYSSVASQLSLILRSILINAIVLIALIFFLRQNWILHSRTNILIFSAVALFLLSFLRLFVFRRFVLARLASHNSRRLMIIGSDGAGRHLLELKQRASDTPFTIVAAADLSGKGGWPEEVALLTDLDRLSLFIQEQNVEEVVLAEDALPYTQALKVITDCRDSGVVLNLASAQFKVIHERVTKAGSEYINISTAPVSFGLKGLYARYFKRPLDIIGAILAIVILSPVLLICTLATVLSSHGPVFFQTDVIGQNGGVFRWFKFRSMRVHAETGPHREHVTEHILQGSRPTGKLSNDTRVTAIGRWMRKHSLDELPQLWNVLKGDMSLVGPRPCLPYEYASYQDWHKERFEVRPGITGLWQVSGRSSVSFNDMVILDLYYIHNLSFWLDAAILVRTIGVVVTGRGGG